MLAEESWFEIMVFRTSTVKDVKGGVSAVELYFEKPSDEY